MVVSISKFITALVAFVSLAAALAPIAIKNNKFVDMNGDPFIIVGVDYQPGGPAIYSDSASSDVLSDADVCLRDAFLLQSLGVNTIRIYTVSPWLNHDACMSILNAVGIYVILDVNSPLSGESINRYQPQDSYNRGYIGRVFAILDAFIGYPNVLGFFAGNEVINDATSAGVAPPYMRAVQRDMKNYIARHSNRTIPVGYSAADDSALRVAGWEYLQCTNSDEDVQMSRSDFYGLNSYSWCSGRDNFQTSGYSSLISTFANSSIPLIFSEFGCNVIRPRTFTEINGGVYTPQMMYVFDGGLIYEYSEEANNYGLVTIDSDGSVTLSAEFVNLQNAYANITYTEISSDATIDSVEPPHCNADAIKTLDSSFDSSLSLPPCPAQDLLENGSGNNNLGRWIPLSDMATNFSITDANGNEITDKSINDVSNQTYYYTSVTSSPATSSSTATPTSTSTSTPAISTSNDPSTTSTTVSTSTSGAMMSSTSSNMLLVILGFLGVTLL
ncbi:Glucanosyltransferase-domain-containing protein [Lipomyces arxii]|uniref:Glucanosyltransferase-domain-containing protein n=1 Tax=Lipomyces arxii TaxID=56418 RepID=UPI0034CD9276